MTPPRAEAVPERLEEEHLGLGPGEPRRAEPERMGAEGRRGFGRHPRLQSRHDAGGLPGDLLRDDGRDERAGRRLGPEPRGGGAMAAPELGHDRIGVEGAARSVVTGHGERGTQLPGSVSVTRTGRRGSGSITSSPPPPASPNTTHAPP